MVRSPGAVEPAWPDLKRSLADLAKQNTDQLTTLAKTRLRRIQHRPGLLDGFLAKTGLDLVPPLSKTGQAPWQWHGGVLPDLRGRARFA